jgi:DNA-binding HxlR family transcriptional regulator
VSILWASNEGAVRFNEFLQVLGTVPPATLAARLGELQAAGVLDREVIGTRPPRVEYRLTRRGRQLCSVLAAVAHFAETG